MIDEWARSVLRIETEKRRLEILRYLAHTPGYEAVADLLRQRCQAIGVPSTSDQIVTAIRWLEEQELISVRSHGLHIIARLTSDGRDAADGSRTVPGVLRPDP